jgi:acetylornithine/N-succinyldiaminopimelate aminotransferase
MSKPITNEALHSSDQQKYLQTFKRYPIVLDHGKGAKVWDIEGKEYIDALAGIAVTNVGHSHPTVVKALQAQVEKLIHISNFYLSVPQVELSQKLVSLSGLDRVFFCNSGAEAVEGAIKIARKYAHSLGKGGTVYSMQGSFHGRTLGTIATGKKAMQNGFEPIPAGFQQLPFNDIAAVEAAYSNQMAAILIEPIQGEGGIRIADTDFLKALRSFCDKKKVVLIFDEIQTGVGRTGKWFAKDHILVEPDIMTLAKGLGGGVPIGAILSNQTVSDAIEFGDHGTTFGGNPLACSAALATLEVIETEDLLTAATELGNWFKAQVMAWQHPRIKEVRGKGLMLGINFDFETKPLALEMLHQGVLVNATAEHILRLVPPLNIQKSELETVLKTIRSALKELGHG